jgi:N-methylhydantoinase A
MCARGMLLTDISFDFVVSDIALIDEAGWHRIQEKFKLLKQQAFDWLMRERVVSCDQHYQAVLDARYVGQNFEVQVAVADLDAPDYAAFAAGFHQAHLREYGYNVLERPIEIINCRVKAVGSVIKAPLPKLSIHTIPPAPISEREVYFGAELGWLATKVYRRSDLGARLSLIGPAIIEEMSSTTVIAPEQTMAVDDYGNLIVHIS